jgi:hypothetical protein
VYLMWSICHVRMSKASSCHDYTPTGCGPGRDTSFRDPSHIIYGVQGPKVALSKRRIVPGTYARKNIQGWHLYLKFIRLVSLFEVY